MTQGRNWFYRLSLAALICIAASSLVWTQAPERLIIVHTNDMHGQVLPKDGIGGMAEMATLIKRFNPDLILDGGDMFTGTMLSDENKGKPLIEIMNRLHFNAAAMGNHEFDYGVEALATRVSEAQFPILSANVKGIPGIKPFTILNVKGLRIGVIGLTTEEIVTTTHPKNLKTVTLTTLLKAMEETMPVVRRQSDFIILVAHLEQEEQFAVAKAFPEVKLIIAGHPHATRTSTVGTTTIVEAGNSLRFIGRLDVRIADKVPVSITEELIPIQGVPPDPEIQALIKPYRDAIELRSSARVGEALGDINRSRDDESPLNDLIADALRETTGTQIGIQNPGGIRANIVKGPITFGSIFETLPFTNTLVTLNMTGTQLKLALSHIVLAVSGLRIEWDMTKPQGSQLVSATLADGKPIVDNQTYSITTNDFVQAGGDGLVEFKGATNVVDTGKYLREAIESYIRKNPAVQPKTDGRVTVKRR